MKHSAKLREQAAIVHTAIVKLDEAIKILKPMAPGWYEEHYIEAAMEQQHNRLVERYYDLLSGAHESEQEDDD
jgi:hypothetical protein